MYAAAAWVMEWQTAASLANFERESSHTGLSPA